MLQSGNRAGIFAAEASRSSRSGWPFPFSAAAKPLKRRLASRAARSAPADGLGDPNGQENGVLRVLPAGFCADAGLPYQPQAPVQTVEKQADVLEKKDPAAGGGRGLQLGQTLVDVLLRLGYVQVLAVDVAKKRISLTMKIRETK